MKLRQKLAVVLATAMVVSAVPVVTFATATTQTKREVITIAKNDTFMDVATANAVKVTFDNEGIENETPEVVYLTLENAEWSNDAFNANKEFQPAKDKDGKVIDDAWEIQLKGSASSNTVKVKAKFEKQDSHVMKVTMTLTPDATNNTYYLPLLVTAKGGDAKVTIENKGNGMLSKKNSYIFATTGEKKFNLKIDDKKSFYRSGELPKITATEAYPKSLKNGGEFKIELNNTDFVFDQKTVEAKGMYGFGGKTVDVTIKQDPDDPSSATITIDGVKADEGDTSLGVVEITGITVKSTTRTPETGLLAGDIKSIGDSMSADINDQPLAEISEYATYLKMKDDKAKDIKAGRIEEIEFEIGENVDDSFVSDREFELKLENGHWDYKGLVDAAKAADKLTGYDTSKGIDYDVAALKIDKEWLAAQLLDNDGDWGTGDNACTAEFGENDGKAVNDTIYFTIGKDDAGKSTQVNKENDVLKFKTKVCVPIDSKEKGQVTLKADGRALEDEMSTTAVNIIDPFTVTTEQAVLKVGLQGQVSGSITLTENDKDMFQKGEVRFTVKDKDEDLGIYLTDLTTETSDSIKGEKTGDNKAGRSAFVKLTRVTKEAGSITFKDLKFTVDRTVPEGTYDLEISGPGVDADGHSLTIPDFIKITTANTQDITNANGLAAATAVFTIGSTTYNVNGIDYTMDAAPYIAGAGYTMIPVRYVANAFGVGAENILFGNGTVTIFAGTRTVQLKAGSNVATVNGTPITMATAAVIKDGRTYIPVGEVANILSISKTWDNDTKTATFSNVNLGK